MAESSAVSPTSPQNMQTYIPPKMPYPEPPSQIANWLNPHRMDKYVASWFARAQNFYELRDKLQHYGRPVRLPLGERKVLGENWQSVVDAEVVYRQAKEAKSGQTKLKELALVVRKRVLTLESGGRASASIALGVAEYDLVYDIFVSQRAEQNPLLNRAGIRDCDLWVRAEPMRQVIVWFKGGHAEERILNLVGPVKCGKTVMLHDVVRSCAEEKCLGASFVITSQLTRQRVYDSFVPTMIDELCAHKASYKNSFCAAYQQVQDGENIFRQAMKSQVEAVFSKAHQYLRPQERQQPLLFAFDAVDSCSQDVLGDICDFIKHVVRYVPAYFIISSSSIRVRVMLSKKGLERSIRTVEVEDFSTARNRKLAEWLASKNVNSLSESLAAAPN